MDDLQAITDNLIKGRATEVKELIQAALDAGISAGDILNKGLIAGMSVVGERFGKKEIFLPEVLLSARAMQAGMSILQPILSASGVKPLAKVALGTVQGDIHEIGKNLVGAMLRGGGFEVIDLGIDVPPQKFVDVIEQGVPLIGMSSLVSTSMPSMKSTIEALEKAELRKQVKVMVGGAIVTQAYADKIGADGYASDAGSAVNKAKELLGLSVSG